jgi:hypothetical protein
MPWAELQSLSRRRVLENIRQFGAVSQEVLEREQRIHAGIQTAEESDVEPDGAGGAWSDGDEPEGLDQRAGNDGDDDGHDDGDDDGDDDPDFPIDWEDDPYFNNIKPYVADLLQGASQ